jgi:hypothetical protein
MAPDVATNQAVARELIEAAVLPIPDAGDVNHGQVARPAGFGKFLRQRLDEQIRLHIAAAGSVNGDGIAWLDEIDGRTRTDDFVAHARSPFIQRFPNINQPHNAKALKGTADYADFADSQKRKCPE